MRKVLIVAILAALLPVSISAAGATKFTFDDVTFSDGTTGVIEASSKVNQKNTATTCNYYTDDYDEYLGYFYTNEVGFTEDQVDEVRQFCLDHFEDRE